MGLPSDITETVLASPLLALVLIIAVVVAYRYQSGLSLKAYRAINRTRVEAFMLLDPLADTMGRSLVNRKGYRGEDAEFHRTSPLAPRDLVRLFRDYGFEFHLIAAVKARLAGDQPGLEACILQMVYTEERPEGLLQTEVYVFADGWGSPSDVYVHTEDSVLDPSGHLTDPQSDGDTYGHVTSALEGQ